MATAAPACRAALDQATKRWPNRDRSSDGVMGDAAHQARVSDHNTGDAFDLTDDPAHGADCESIRLAIIRDPRTKYVIHNRKTWSRTLPFWHRYGGSNPHTGHMHVSIIASKRSGTGPWIGIATTPTPPVKAPDWWLVSYRTKRTGLSTTVQTYGILTLGVKVMTEPRADGSRAFLAHCSGKAALKLAAYALVRGIVCRVQRTTLTNSDADMKSVLKGE